MQLLENNIRKKIDLLLILKFLIILNIIIPSLSSTFQCEYNTPFLYLQNGNCENANNFPPYSIESGECEISNETLKIQYLNNIRSFNYPDAELTKFDIHISINGNLVFLGFTSEEGNKDKRLFYVLNKDGRGYFTDQITKEENAISTFEGLSDSKDSGHLFSFILENKEYIWAISLNNLIELYDLDAHAKYEFSVSQILGSYFYTPHISSFLEIDNNYYLGLKGINEEKILFFYIN